MEVNNLLCVGRSRLSQFRTEKMSHGKNISNSKTHSLREMDIESGLDENDLISGTSSKLPTGSISPPTRSILRGKAPSPNQGSPSSLRNVRFSDKERGEEILYAKIHVNKNVQTENSSKDKKPIEAAEGNYNPLKLQFGEDPEDSNEPNVHEIKTSTPRYSHFEETPSLDFHTPRGREEKPETLVKSPRTNKTQFSHDSSYTAVTKIKRPSSEHERIIIDIDIDRKKPNHDKSELFESRSPKRAEQKQNKVTTDLRPSGNEIIRNMDLNLSTRSKSPEIPKPIIPDGNRIIRNLELSENGVKFKSMASQTSSSEASSPRSASPETQSSNPDIPDGSEIIKNMEFGSHISKTSSVSVQTPGIPDGNKIIQNLDLGSSRDSSRENKSESMRSMDIQDGKRIIQNLELSSVSTDRRNKSVEVQTLEQEPFRSVPTQTEEENSEIGSPDVSFEEDSTSRSIGVQTPEPPEPKIPDGSKITKNMDIHRSVKPQHYTESSHGNRALNNGNWNEFVRHLELFNPSSSSSSSASVIDDETPALPISEPVLVYDRNASSPQNVSPYPTNNKKSQSPVRLSERSARKFLESEAFTRHQFESVLKEEGIFSKVKLAKDPTMASKSVVDRGFEKRDKSQGTDYVMKPVSVPNMFANNKTSTQYKQSSMPQRTDVKTPRVSKPGHGLDSKLESGKKETRNQRSDKDSLGFTPIETYSFNPETLMKTASNRAFSSQKAPSVEGQTDRSPASSATSNILSSTLARESVSKNAFVQGLDLGPMPLSSSKQQRTSTSIPVNAYDRSQTESYKGSVTARSYDSSQNSTLPGHYSPSLIRSTAPSPLAILPDRTPMSSNTRSSYSHVTGHSSNHPVSSYSTLERHHSLQYRPSSAPLSRTHMSPRTSTLTSSLKEMRSSMVRKLAMGHCSDHKKEYSKSASSYRIKSYTDTYHKASEVKCAPTPEASYSSRLLSPSRSSRSSYLNALNDKSNVRPRSRERSRSRSPMTSSRTAYDKRYSEIQRSTNVRENEGDIRASYSEKNFGVGVRTEHVRESRGSFDSVITRGTHNKSDVTTSQKAEISVIENKRKIPTQRESRSLTRKPPLPSKMKMPRSRSSKSSRSRSRSADHASEVSSQGKETKIQASGESMSETLKPRPVLKEILSNHEVSDSGNRSRDSSSHKLGTVTIGTVPIGLADPDCLFLGHDTIQKIINEAKL